MVTVLLWTTSDGPCRLHARVSVSTQKVHALSRTAVRNVESCWTSCEASILKGGWTWMP